MTNIYAVCLALIPAILNFGILVYLLYFLPRGKTTNIFALFIIALMMWQCEDVLGRTLSDVQLMRFWDQMLCLGWIAISPLLLHFSIRFTALTKLRRSGVPAALIYMPFLIFYMIYVSNPQQVPFRYDAFWGYTAIPREGSLDLIQRYFITLGVIASIVILFRYAFQLHGTASIKRRNQAFIIAVGITLPGIQGIITQVLGPALFNQEIPLTTFSMTVLSFSVILALGRFRLFNVSDSLGVEGLLDNLNNMVLMVNPQGVIIYKNDYARRVLGLPHENEGLSLHRILAPDQQGDFSKRILEATMEGKQFSDYEVQLLGATGEELQVLMTSELVVNNGVRQGILLIGHDITERKHYLSAIELQNRKLSEIAWAQAHLVRAPLARILGLTQIFELTTVDDHERDEILVYLRDAAKELDEVVKDMVRDSQPQSEAFPQSASEPSTLESGG